MKTKLLGLMLLAVLTLISCKEQAPQTEMAEEASEAPDYAAFDKKVEIIRAFYKAHGEENLEAQSAMLSEDLKWSPPAYNGNEWLGKEDLLAALKNYHDAFDNIQWHEGIVMADSTVNGYWSGSVFPQATATDVPGVIRVYGTWSATHTESGKEIGLKFFNLTTINDQGMIVESSDYFDVNGLAAQIAADD